MSKLRRLDLDDFEFILDSLIDYHKDRDEPIPKNYNLDRVESSLSQPFLVLFGRQCYPGFLRKAAVLFYLFCKNHCLENGNKRMAITILYFFCYLNNRALIISDPAFHTMAITVAESDPDDMPHVINFVMDLLSKSIKPI